MHSQSSDDPSLSDPSPPVSPRMKPLNFSEDHKDALSEGSQSGELQNYQHLFSPTATTSGDPNSQTVKEELKLAPIVWWDAKQHFGHVLGPREGMQQYAILGHLPDVKEQPIRPALLNTNSPWSAFLCGSQGSGKSHTMSCMLENCLLDRASIGKNPNPLAGLVLYFDRTQGNGVCEAAYLSSSIPTRVLVSPSNFGKLKEQYDKLAKDKQGDIKVEKLRLLPDRHLDTERMKALMATGKDGELHPYMHVLIKILRDLVIESDGLGHFDYRKFKDRMNEQLFLEKQTGPLKMRMELLESFLDLSATKVADTSKSKRQNQARKIKLDSSHDKTAHDFLEGEPGTLTIVDLTDSNVDSDMACVLFDICLSIFISQTKCSKVVALDEAHNYMTTSGSSVVQTFTEKLLKTIREQRHQATRVIIATQEPTINTQLLDLFSITMVHRCTSPAWFAILKKHVAGIFLNGDTRHNSEDSDGTNDGQALFKQIVGLKLGESLLFCPTAAGG